MKKIRTVVFLTNYLNHHQKFLADAFFRLLGNNYTFIETVPMEAFRKQMGWAIEDAPYLLQAHKGTDEKKQANKLIAEADVVIAGSTPEEFLRDRIKQKKIIFRYSERPIKSKKWYWSKFLIRFFRFHSWNPIGTPIFLLCSSAYASNDYMKFQLFKGKCYKWGYFLENEILNIYDVVKRKKGNRIIWCGRLIKLKHLEETLFAFAKIVNKGINATLDIIGEGELQNEYISLTTNLGIAEYVRFLGKKKPKEVRSMMKEAGIFVFSSNFEEGWGAVVNEAMNSGCAIVASSSAGSVPYLIENGKNGFSYESGNTSELSSLLEELLKNQDLRESFGINAYQTIVSEWSADTAVKRFLALAEVLKADGLQRNVVLFQKGPCSVAEILRSK